MGDTEEHTDVSPDVKPVRNEEECLVGPRFSPPLYRQRYRLCADILNKHEITSMIDFGCDDCQLLRDLKSVTSLTRIALVDIDSVCLEMSKGKTRPLITDYLVPRENPLTITMYQGSVTDFDSRLADFEAATMVEVIEHLPEKPLKEFPSNLFGKLHPHLVIITTPNVEFNVLFLDKIGFRHWDHKFEWTREEFKQWCTEQADKYGYDVEYTGVGEAPPGSEPLGFCSQVAIFVSRTNQRPDNIPDCHKYNLICSSVHPHRVETMTEEERLKLDVDYYLRNLSHDQVLSHDQDTSHEEDLSADYETKFIPIYKLHNFTRLKKHFKTVDDLRQYLIDHQYPLSDDQANVIYAIEYDDSSEASEGEDAENDWTVDNTTWGLSEPEEMWD